MAAPDQPDARTALSDPAAALVAALAGQAGVTWGAGRRGFGSAALCVDGRIFAIPRPDGLVLKLPRQRVAELLASQDGSGSPFDAGKGRPLREWVVVGLSAEPRWRELAEEARAFVASHSTRP